MEGESPRVSLEFDESERLVPSPPSFLSLTSCRLEPRLSSERSLVELEEPFSDDGESFFEPPSNRFDPVEELDLELRLRPPSVRSFFFPPSPLDPESDDDLPVAELEEPLDE